jgi:hypothetical protein
MATYKDEIELVENTFGKEVHLQAQDSDGNGVPLTGCTVKWHVHEPAGSTCVLIATCTEVDLSVGKVKYTLLEADWGSNKLEGGKDYKSSLIATKSGYHEEFPGLIVRTVTKAPTS